VPCNSLWKYAAFSKFDFPNSRRNAPFIRSKQTQPKLAGTNTFATRVSTFELGLLTPKESPAANRTVHTGHDRILRQRASDTHHAHGPYKERARQTGERDYLTSRSQRSRVDFDLHPTLCSEIVILHLSSFYLYSRASSLHGNTIPSFRPSLPSIKIPAPTGENPLA
jgi:hypothetical protein